MDRYKVPLVAASVLALFSGGCGSGGSIDSAGPGEPGGTTSCENTGTSTTVTLSWSPPDTNTDGTPLIDLSGYRVYYGTTSGDYSTVISVGDTVTYQVAGLSPGNTYYFTVTAYDTSLNESGFSNEACKNIL